MDHQNEDARYAVEEMFPFGFNPIPNGIFVLEIGSLSTTLYLSKDANIGCVDKMYDLQIKYLRNETESTK